MRCIYRQWHWLWPPASGDVGYWYWLTQVSVVSCLIILSGVLGTQFATIPGNVSAVWVPDALALAAMLIWGWRIWPGIFMGTLLPGLITLNLTPLFIVSLVLISFGDVLTAIASTALIQRFTRTRYPFNRTSDVLFFIAFGVCLNQLLDATIGTFLLIISNILAWSDVGTVFLTWWISGSAGIMIVTPPLLTWYFLVYHPWRYEQKPLNIQPINCEFALWLSLIFIVSSLAFWYRFSIEYLILVLLIWSVFRFSRPWTTLTISLLSVAAILGTAQERSTFIKEDINQSLLFLDSFIGTLSITTLFLMAILEERSQLVRKLEQAKDNLEASVTQRTHELSEANEKLRKISITDSLTQCFNRLKIDELLDYNLALYHRYKQIFSIILFDLDYFKRVNDHHGHLVGDALLVEIVRLFQKRLRNTDILGRWGGEEFIIICPNTSSSDAYKLAEKLRQVLASTNFEPVGYTTASFGIVECGERHQLPQDLIRHADEALYEAKAMGRNCTVVYHRSLDSINSFSRASE